MRTLSAMLTLAALQFVAGGCFCAQHKEMTPVALEDALASLGRGLAEMKKAQVDANGGQEFNTGLVPSEAEVTFAVSRARTENGKLYIELSAAPLSGSNK